MSTSTEPRRALSALPQRAEEISPSHIQRLAVVLGGMTAGDYLAWVWDSEPPALGRDLRSVTVDADPVGERIDLELVWDRQPPAPNAAVAAAGFPLTPDVVAVHDRRYGTDKREESHVHNLHIQTALVEARIDDLHRAAAGATYQRWVSSADPTGPISVRAVRELIARWITGGGRLRTTP